MFSFGDDDKDKLKENMEQIKQMINHGDQEEEPLQDFPANQGEAFGEKEGFPDQETQSETFDDQQSFPDQDNFSNQEQFPPERDDSPQEEQEGFPPQQEQPQQQGFPDQEAQKQQSFQENQQPQEPQPQKPEQEQQGQQGFQQENIQQEKQPQQNKQTDQDSGARTSTGSKELENLNQEIPSPPENREVNVPEIEKGPLFIRQRKFRRAREMLQEMMYLSGEIQETVNSLEAGIQEDRQTENQVREMLQEFETDRSEVEDIVSPEE